MRADHKYSIFLNYYVTINLSVIVVRGGYSSYIENYLTSVHVKLNTYLKLSRPVIANLKSSRIMSPPHEEPLQISHPTIDSKHPILSLLFSVQHIPLSEA